MSKVRKMRKSLGDMPVGVRIKACPARNQVADIAGGASFPAALNTIIQQPKGC